jgi:hypothetical protein
VATTNANDSRPRDYRGREARSNENYKPRNSQEYRSSGGMSASKNQEKKPFNRENKPSYKDSKPFVKNSTPYGEKNNKDVRFAGNNKNKDFKGVGYNKDKDYDSDNKYGRGNGKDQRMGESRLKTGQNKEKEQQPNKFETIKRLEKEKKAIQKKNEEINKKSDRPNRPVLKQRRTNNIDWTKGYANGLYGDDDEDYTEYL